MSKKSTALTVEHNRREIALSAEAVAQKALTDRVSSLAGYQDENGDGPKAESLKGIMISVARRITLRYGYKIKEMPEPMLRHVEQLKFDLDQLLAQLIQRRTPYRELKDSLWERVDRYAEEYQRRDAACRVVTPH